MTETAVETPQHCSLDRRPSSLCSQRQRRAVSSAFRPDPASLHQRMKSDLGNEEEEARTVLFLQKLRRCHDCPHSFLAQEVIADDAARLRNREIRERKKTLCELTEIVEGLSAKDATEFTLTEEICSTLFSMAAQHLFRSQPPSGTFEDFQGTEAIEEESEEPQNTETWKMLKPVYRLLFRVLVSPMFVPHTALHSLDHRWLSEVISLFDSPIAQERIWVQKIVHRIYARFPTLRTQIRHNIQNVFLAVAFEHQPHRGISEMLELLGSIILGFAVPLQKEHVEFLKVALLPLHKSSLFLKFCPQLVYCITKYLEKDPSLLPLVIDGLLSYWTPKCGSVKELLFLSEIDDILAAVPKGEPLDRALPSIAAKLATCVSSPHFQVAEKALGLFQRRHVMKICRHQLPVIFPTLVAPLQENIKSHWNREVRILSRSLLNWLMRMDPVRYAHCVEHLDRIKSRSSLRRDSSSRPLVL